MEIGTGDAAASRDFFAAVMGWSFRGELGQGWFESEGGPIGLHGGDAPMIVTYFPTEDIEAATAKVMDVGGTVHGEIADEEGFGRFATCSDPAGVRFGLHQKA